MIKSEPHPALVTHAMPDESHEPTLSCWCNPKVNNDGNRDARTTVVHSALVGSRYMASKAD